MSHTHTYLPMWMHINRDKYDCVYLAKVMSQTTHNKLTHHHCDSRRYLCHNASSLRLYAWRRWSNTWAGACHHCTGYPIWPGWRWRTFCVTPMVRYACRFVLTVCMLHSLHGGTIGEAVRDTLQHRQQASLSLRSSVQHERRKHFESGNEMKKHFFFLQISWCWPVENWSIATICVSVHDVNALHAWLWYMYKLFEFQSKDEWKMVENWFLMVFNAVEFQVMLVIYENWCLEICSV